MKGHYAPLQHLEDVIQNAANIVPCDISNDFKETYDNEIHFHKVTAELRFLPDIIKQCLPEVKRVTTMDTVISAMIQGQNGTFILPEDFSSHSHESDIPDIGTIENDEKPPDPPPPPIYTAAVYFY